MQAAVCLKCTSSLESYCCLSGEKGESSVTAPQHQLEAKARVDRSIKQSITPETAVHFQFPISSTLASLSRDSSRFQTGY